MRPVDFLAAVTLFVHVAAVVCVAGPPFRPPQGGGGFPPSVSTTARKRSRYPSSLQPRPPTSDNNSFQGVQVSPRQNFQPFVTNTSPPIRTTPAVNVGVPAIVRPPATLPTLPPPQTLQSTEGRSRAPRSSNRPVRCGQARRNPPSPCR